MNERLDKLFRSQRGECHFCGRRCRMPRPGGGNGEDDIATLDHVFDRHHPMRDARRTEAQLHVMACRKCNVQHVGRRVQKDELGERSDTFVPIPPLR